jgi:hypothetical protein
MERLRLFERRIIRACTRPGRKPVTHYHFNNKSLYEGSGVDRIDRYMVSLSKKFLDNLPNVNNDIIRHCMGVHSTDYHLDPSKKYKSPFHLGALSGNNQLYNANGELTYYHRRYNSNNNDLVYNVQQNLA